jgi:hypothetical protein
MEVNSLCKKTKKSCFQPKSLSTIYAHYTKNGYVFIAVLVPHGHNAQKPPTLCENVGDI